MFTLVTSIQHGTEILAKAIRQEKEIKNIQIRNSEIINVCWSYIQKTTKTAKKLLEWINDTVKLQDTKLTKQSVAFLYTNNKLSEKEIKKTIPFTIATKEKY